eukprot:2500831-Prymnesium_polylepis.1
MALPQPRHSPRLYNFQRSRLPWRGSRAQAVRQTTECQRGEHRRRGCRQRAQQPRHHSSAPERWLRTHIWHSTSLGTRTCTSAECTRRRPASPSHLARTSANIHRGTDTSTTPAPHLRRNVRASKREWRHELETDCSEPP